MPKLLARHAQGATELQPLADAIVEAGERGAELTQRLLAFSRRQILQPASIDCNALVERMQGCCAARCARTSTCRYGARRGPVRRATPTPPSSRIALLNLALNARTPCRTAAMLTITTDQLALDERYRDLHPEVHAGPLRHRSA